MFQIKSTFSFEAAHRLYDVDTYSSECRENLHGHSYKLTVWLERLLLPADNPMVMDFKLFKKIITETIIDKYDHACVLCEQDPLAQPIKDNCTKVILTRHAPTAEWMAMQFCDELAASFWKATHDPHLHVVRVDVQETENNIATYRKDAFDEDF